MPRAVERSLPTLASPGCEEERRKKKNRPSTGTNYRPVHVESGALYRARYMQKRAIEIQKEQRVWSELLMVWCER